MDYAVKNKFPKIKKSVIKQAAELSVGWST